MSLSRLSSVAQYLIYEGSKQSRPVSGKKHLHPYPILPRACMPTLISWTSAYCILPTRIEANCEKLPSLSSKNLPESTVQSDTPIA